MAEALSSFRICDFTGQLAGAGATKWLASFGTEVIRIEDPLQQGRWDILRGAPPFVDERRGINLGGAFNNHNAGKYGITLNLRCRQAPGRSGGVRRNSANTTPRCSTRSSWAETHRKRPSRR